MLINSSADRLSHLEILTLARNESMTADQIAQGTHNEIGELY
jgi:hypothetical protein